tara:strand:- start:365 stop:556 length:192 start_codon:yes stop_codon:yes gene_type:complete
VPLSDKEYKDWKSRVPALVGWMEQNNIPLDKIKDYYSDAVLLGIQESHKHLLKDKDKGEDDGA